MTLADHLRRIQIDILNWPVRTPNGKFKVDSNDIHISDAFKSGFIFESKLVNETLRSYIEKSRYVADVGANIGCHSISYAGFNPECEIFSFEPQKELFDILTQNIALNGLDQRVKPFQCALGHADMEASLRPLQSEAVPYSPRFNKGGLGIGLGGERIILKTLDSFELPGLDFLKIDVEGAEGLVIQGGAKTIGKYKPVVFFEHNFQRVDPGVLGLNRIPTPFEALAKLGYRTFHYVDVDNYLTEG